jgi:hypothetical protein
MIYLKIVGAVLCLIILGFAFYLGCSNLITAEKKFWLGLPFRKKRARRQKDEE